MILRTNKFVFGVNSMVLTRAVVAAIFFSIFFSLYSRDYCVQWVLLVLAVTTGVVGILEKINLSTPLWFFCFPSEAGQNGKVWFSSGFPMFRIICCSDLATEISSEIVSLGRYRQGYSAKLTLKRKDGVDIVVLCYGGDASRAYTLFFSACGGSPKID